MLVGVSHKNLSVRSKKVRPSMRILVKEDPEIGRISKGINMKRIPDSSRKNSHFNHEK